MMCIRCILGVRREDRTTREELLRKVTAPAWRLYWRGDSYAVSATRWGWMTSDYRANIVWKTLICQHRCWSTEQTSQKLHHDIASQIRGTSWFPGGSLHTAKQLAFRLSRWSPQVRGEALRAHAITAAASSPISKPEHHTWRRRVPLPNLWQGLHLSPRSLQPPESTRAQTKRGGRRRRTRRTSISK